MKKHGISSLAAPIEADTITMRSLSEEQRRAVIAEHVRQGSLDIAEGRYTTFSSGQDIHDFF